MLKVILYGLLIWFIYNLVFRFIIPIYQTSRDVRKKFREMQNQMQDQQQFAAGSQKTKAEKSAANASQGDYIDFEEVK